MARARKIPADQVLFESHRGRASYLFKKSDLDEFKRSREDGRRRRRGPNKVALSPKFEPKSKPHKSELTHEQTFRAEYALLLDHLRTMVPRLSTQELTEIVEIAFSAMDEAGATDETGAESVDVSAGVAVVHGLFAEFDKTGRVLRLRHDLDREFGRAFHEHVDDFVRDRAHFSTCGNNLYSADGSAVYMVDTIDVDGECLITDQFIWMLLDVESYADIARGRVAKIISTALLGD